MEAAEGKLIVLQVGVVALLHLILALEVVLKAEGTLEEARNEQIPALVLCPPRFDWVVLKSVVLQGTAEKLHIVSAWGGVSDIY